MGNEDQPQAGVGKLGTVLPESCYDGILGLPWGHGSSVCFSWELLGPKGAAQGTSIIFQ